jgi:hypothetical protein
MSWVFGDWWAGHTSNIPSTPALCSSALSMARFAHPLCKCFSASVGSVSPARLCPHASYWQQRAQHHSEEDPSQLVELYEMDLSSMGKDSILPGCIHSWRTITEDSLIGGRRGSTRAPQLQINFTLSILRHSPAHSDAIEATDHVSLSVASSCNVPAVSWPSNNITNQPCFRRCLSGPTNSTPPYHALLVHILPPRRSKWRFHV